MKKKSIFALCALFALVPAAALAGCTTDTSLPITANWHKNTGTRDNLTGTRETLVYTVTHEKASGSEGFYVVYDEGTYTTTLTYEDSPTMRYRYCTELTITGHFVLNGEESGSFSDTVTTDSVFLTVGDGLRPISTVKGIYSTTPLATPSAGSSVTLEENSAYRTYNYTVTTEYAADMTSAETVTVSYNANDRDRLNAVTTVEKSVSLSGGGSFFDNDVYLFALRGLDMSSSFSFRTIDPQTMRQATVTAASTPTAITYTPAFGGLTDPIDAYQVSVGYNSSYPGQAQTLIYAKKSADTANNVYRNALLEMSVPVVNSQGTLTYKLTEATFTEN